jgi:hypothetical protein
MSQSGNDCRILLKYWLDDQRVTTIRTLVDALVVTISFVFNDSPIPVYRRLVTTEATDELSLCTG